VIRLATIAGVWAVLIAGCGGDGGDTADPDRSGDQADVGRPTCSAAGLEWDESPPPGLPPPVAEMREAILEGAVACDYARLEALALEGGTSFSYSFGDDSSPSAYWRTLEGQDEDPMAMLVRTLALPFARETNDLPPLILYAWPSAFSEGATGFDWLAVEGLYSDEEIASFIEQGAFLGWRVGITEDGDWRFFVAGD
jgi:hypothetical protein